MTTIRPAQPKDFFQLAGMRACLWPDTSFNEHFSELESSSIHSGQPGFPIVVLVAEEAPGTLTGFLEASLRSHADGCDPARPVGFVEGWFVAKEDRGKGVGRALMRAAEEWARAHGCREIASDALIDNAGSEGAHTKLGFEVVDRCIHFRKAL